jgi:hypothetical protein
MRQRLRTDRRLGIRRRFMREGVRAARPRETELRGKFAKCKIKTRKEEGGSLNLIAACATDIMLSNVQFVLKVIDDDNITRVFPGIEGMEVRYHRCRL